MSLLNLSNEFLAQCQIVDWGYTEASKPDTFAHFEKWVGEGLNGPLGYLSDHRKGLRKDLKNIFPEFKSAIVFLFDYTPEKKRLINEKNPLKIASYVSGFEGMDYHAWIKEKFDLIRSKMQKEIPDLQCFYSIDVHPALERDLAYRAGLGWFGKNAMLISKKHGSYTIIGSMLFNQKLPLKTPAALEPDHCGSCSACVDYCPTSAIVDNKVVDASKCVSSYTIELFKEAEPPIGYPAESGEIFGCDICQEVCPWNNKPLQKASLNAKSEWLSFFERQPGEILAELETMSNREYRRKFKNTPLERTGRLGMIKNLNKLKF